MTYGLIATNVAIFYGIQPVLGWEFIGNHLVFAPMEPNAWNVPVSAVSAMFLHGSPGHLWGNMIFLWTLGSVVERRLSRRTFILAYLGTGLAAGLISLGVGWFFMGGVIHGLGASGAIAGLMGIFVVRCYFKTMIFPLPILGIFSLIVPLAVKVRLNSMVVIGLFFFADLSGGIGQITGTSYSNVGHWAHIGGMLAGLAVARRLELHREAVVERHIDIGERGLDDPYAKAGEESLRRVLASHPDNWEATLLLARTLSRPHRSDEGAELFRRAIRGLLAQSPGEAAEAFREYYGLYLRGVDPAIDLRLARIFGGNGDSELASRCLESVVRDANAAPELREKAMYQLAVTLKGLGHDEAALDYFGEFLQTFPDSPLAPKVRSRMGTL